MILPGNYIDESTVANSDFPDCFGQKSSDDPNGGCAFGIDGGGNMPQPRWVFSTLSMMEDGWLGKIDGECKEGPGEPGMSAELDDRDFLVIDTSARSMITFTMTPTSGSLQPAIFTRDGGGGALTFAGASEAGMPTTTQVVPVTDDGRLVVSLHDAVNLGVSNCNSFVGGDDYGYALTYNVTPFAPQELGDIASGSTQQLANQSIAGEGILNYYRFSAPHTAAPTITITRQSGASEDFQILAFGTNTIGGRQLVWVMPQFDGDDDNASPGAVTISAGHFTTCTGDGCNDGSMGEYIFGITDTNGNGGADFTYDIEISVQ